MGSAQDRIDRVADTQITQKTVLANALGADGVIEFIHHVAPGLDPQGVIRVALSHVLNTTTLRRCSPPSIVRAVMEAAKLGLTVDGVLGHAYLVPFKSDATMMIGYRGIMHLAYQSEKVTRFHMDTICERDRWKYSEGVEVIFRHERELNDRGEIIGAYAIAHLVAGGPPLVAVLGMDEIEARRGRSASYRSNPHKSPWTTDLAAMCKKSAARELGKVLPVPTLQTASLRDEAREDGREVPPSVIDLGPDEATVTDDVPSECPRCGRLDLRADGTCPDCEPREREPGEEG